MNQYSFSLCWHSHGNQRLCGDATRLDQLRVHFQTGDGLVHVTYTWKRERIKHAVIDPAKLELRPIWDGIRPK